MIMFLSLRVDVSASHIQPLLASLFDHVLFQVISQVQRRGVNVVTRVRRAVAVHGEFCGLRKPVSSVSRLSVLYSVA
jgi:hypothetical protein